MRDIESLLKRTANEDFEVPQKIHHRVQYTLNNKRRNNKKFFFKKLVTVVASFALVLIGSVSVYAACGGTINGKPVIEWLGIKFSKEEYDNYKVEVKDKQFSYNETTINLVSTVCDEGFTILEFDVKLSKEDKKQLKLDEPVLPEGWEDRTEEFEIDQVEEARIRNDFEGKIIDSIYISFNNQITYDENGVLMDNINNYTVIIDGEEIGRAHV